MLSKTNLFSDELIKSRNDFVTNYPHYKHWKKSHVDEMFKEKPINIYIHVPFCVQKCNYCYYLTVLYQNQEQINGYVDAVIKEIKLANEKFNLKGRQVNSIYFGGGTPSLLKIDQFQKIVDCLKSNFNIETPEFTVENEPRLIQKDKILAYKNMGVNRISMGVQSFCDDVIKLSGRGHTGDQAIKAIDIIKKINDININIDLLCGLPGETKEKWINSVNTAISTNVENLTIYKMQNYANTVFFEKSVRSNEIYLPTDEEEIGLMQVAINLLEKSTYKFWSNFTFVRDNKYPQLFIENIWKKDEDLCAFGTSAFGKINDFCYQNSNDLKFYLNSLKSDNLPINRAYKLTALDQILRDIVLNFKFEYFDLNEFELKHGINIKILLPELFELLSVNDFIKIDNNRVYLTSKGILYCDFVGKKLASELNKYFGKDGKNIY